MKNIALIVLLLASAGAVFPDLAVPTAEAAEPAPVDAGLATTVAGEVTVKGEGAKEALPLTAYMKVRVGDEIRIPEGGKVQLVFFTGGLRESWAGPVTLMVGETSAQGGDAVPERDEVGGMVGHSLETLPGIMRRAEIDLAGQRKIRGSAPELGLDEAEQAQLTHARGTFEKLSSAAPAEDVLAHVSFASLLIELGQYREAKVVLGAASERCPECETPATLLRWLERR